MIATQVRHLSWPGYRLTDYASIERWWELVMSGYALVSLQALAEETSNAALANAGTSPDDPSCLGGGLACIVQIHIHRPRLHVAYKLVMAIEPGNRRCGALNFGRVAEMRDDEEESGMLGGVLLQGGGIDRLGGIGGIGWPL